MMLKNFLKTKQMPEYIYRCSICKREEEVSHSMSECDNPSKETIMKTTCNEITCSRHDSIYGNEWKKVPQLTSFLSFGSGDGMKGGTLSKEEKNSRIQKRADKYMPKSEKENREKKDVELFNSIKNEQR